MELRQIARTGKEKRWVISIENNEVTVSHGLVGGKMSDPTVQTFEAVNVGKKNEKSPAQVAQAWMDKRIKDQIKKGYDFGDATDRPTTEIVFGNLSESLRFYKPQNTMNRYLQKMMDAGTAMWLRKRNGNMHFVEVDDHGDMKLYSSTTQQHQKDEMGGPLLFDRYPRIKEELAVMNLPPRTILLGEICTTSGGGFVDEEGYDLEDLDYVNGVRGALTPAALADQEENGELGFCIWDIAFWAGECVLQTVPIAKRIQRIIDILDGATRRERRAGLLTFPEVATVDEGIPGYVNIVSSAGDFDIVLGDRTPEETLIELAAELKWEGWVVVDPKAVYEDKAYNFRGKAERPKFCAKLKPTFEADFIARWDPDNGVGKRGKGKKSVGVGSLQLSLMHPTRGEIEVSLCGGGLTDDLVKSLADPKLYPLVVQVEYTTWTKYGSLQFPEFMRVRDDKSLDECEVIQNPDWEKHYAEA